MKVNEVMKVLKDHGYKSTEQRKAIVQSIFQDNKYLTAKDILHQVKIIYPNISLDTIYRNLTTLVELDLIEVNQQDGEAKYKAPCIGNHHHHMICSVCGDMSITTKCPMEIILKDFEEDFKILNHKFEIYGICKKCQEKSKLL
ncbi:MAG: Fur family transcriptional regulator [Vulcanibacillus sp.]